MDSKTDNNNLDQVSDQTAHQVTEPSIAAPEDDIIDAAWIARAKQIVLATTNDPAAQSQQLAALKIAYLDKRYNKKVSTNAT